MACSVIHRCPVCGFEIEAWSDGHPYILDDRNRPQFYYHPCEDERERILASCDWARFKTDEELSDLLQVKSGIMSDMICLDCAGKFKCDTEKKKPKCRKCGSENVHDQFKLEGVTCPKCHRGRFPDVPEEGAIS